MAKQQPKKLKRFAQKKGGATIAQSSKKRAQVPVGRIKEDSGYVPPPARPVVPPAPVPPAAPLAVHAPQPAPHPVQPQQQQQQYHQPQPQQHQPQPVYIQQQPQQQPPLQMPTMNPAMPPAQQMQPMQPMQPSVPPQMAPPPPMHPVATTPPLQGIIHHPPAQQESINMPTQINHPTASLVAGQRTGAQPKPQRKKVLKGKTAVQTESEDLKDEVASYLEVCDSCLSDHNTPQDIADVVHMLVRSLNFDVVTIALLDKNKDTLIGGIASRGYTTPPTDAVISCWGNSVVKGYGIDWKKLMKIAGNTQTELAYWIIHEGLDSIGYVPIRDSNTIYGFLFVAAKDHQKLSDLTSPLLDACGSRIGLATALKYMKPDTPQEALQLGNNIKNQLSLLMGYMDMLKNGHSMPPENFNTLLDHCNTSLMESIKMLDAMMPEIV